MAATIIKIPAPLGKLISFCETKCHAYCCYEAAFNLSTEQVRQWIDAMGNEEFTRAQNQLAHLIWQVELSIGKIDCQPFCWLDDRNALLVWLRKLEQIINDCGSAA